MATIYLDESGFTGSNLCDPQQPVFALATHLLSECESAAIAAEYFGNTQASELKYSRLARRPAGQDMIVRCVAALRQHRERVRIAYAYKPFVLLCKAIDWIVEPSMRRMGFNLYEQGANLAMANAIHFIVPTLAGADYYGRLLGSLQTYMRDPGQQAFVDVCDCLAEQTGEFPNLRSGPAAGTLEDLYLAMLNSHPEDASRLSSSNLEFAFSLTVAVMHEWKGIVGPGMELIHDATSAMSRQRDYWEALTSPNAPEMLIGYDRRTTQFPIGISRTVFEPSENHRGLQIADILAGVTADCLAVQLDSNSPSTPFTERLWEQFDGWDVAEHISPEAKFTPEELGTVGEAAADPTAYIGGIFSAVAAQRAHERLQAKKSQ